MVVPVLIEVPIGVVILIISPFFAAVILTIIYVHRVDDSRKVDLSNDDGDSGNNSP